MSQRNTFMLGELYANWGLCIRDSNARRRGTRADFQVLIDSGIDLKDKIAMANYGGVYRGTKVKNAQDNGMAGCIIFTDPLDDGEVTEENGYEAYPSPPSPPQLIYDTG